MRIIEQGPNEFSHEFTCAQCGTRLAADADDVRLGWFGNFDERERAYYLECPVCYRAHRLETNNIPYRVRQAADRRKK